MSSKDELFDGAIHRSVQAQIYKEQQYAQSGKRDARPYVERDQCIEISLEQYRQRMHAWIENAPYEEEKCARLAYQKAFETEINKPHPDYCLCDECAAFRYTVTGEPD